jgi:protein-L-isoaspartate(D-aspartate) O-methyltransferase
LTAARSNSVQTMNPTERFAELGRRIGALALARHAESVAPEEHAEFAALSRACRTNLARTIDSQLGPFAPLHLEALRDVPRERFVRPGDQDRSAEDVPLPLDDDGLATISAPHAYLLSFRLLDLSRGDRLVELGSGSGYGAALGAYIVGPRGRVVTLEIDGALHARAYTLLDPPNVVVLQADAVRSTHLWGDGNRIVCTFAVERLPEEWLAALPDGGILVAPVAARDRDQQLTRVVRRGPELMITEHGGVRYVKNRSPR